MKLENKSEVSWSAKILADFVFFAHLLIMMYIAIGWLGPEDWMLWGVLILYAGTELMWILTGSCILTDWEREIRGISESTSDTFFMVRVIYYISGLEVSPEKAIMFTKIWGRFACIISIIRLLI